MGAYAPAPVATPDILDKVMKEALLPTINGMRKEGESSANAIFVFSEACFQDFHLLALSLQDSSSPHRGQKF
jgi:dihydroxyacetone kinase